MTRRQLSPLSSAAQACLGAAAASPYPLGVTAADLRPQWLQRARTLAEVDEAMRSQVRTTRIAVYCLEHGAKVPGDLAELAWQIGLGASVQMRLCGPADLLTRRLHGALRSVHQMALTGYRWNERYAMAIEQAVGEAADLVSAHAGLAIELRHDADWLGHRIQTQTTEPGDVAGAELYRSQP